MALTLTESAAKEMKRMLSERNKPDTTLVRIGVVGGGCSGFEYQMDFAEPAGGQDVRLRLFVRGITPPEREWAGFHRRGAEGRMNNAK